jgi:two-component system LytT family response regulator
MPSAANPDNPPQKLRVLIVDDEPLACQFLARMLFTDGDLAEIRTSDSAAGGREEIDRFCPHILFLDVAMPGESGMKMLETIPTASLPIVIFTTAYSQFAPQAFDVQACDFLLKPFDRERLFTALDRAKSALRNRSRTGRSPRMLSVPVKDGVLRVLVSEIDYITADDNYVVLHGLRQELILRSTLASLERKLQRDRFVRIHRRTLVNADRIQQVHRSRAQGYDVILQSGTRLRCSRRHGQRLRAMFDSQPSRVTKHHSDK